MWIRSQDGKNLSNVKVVYVWGVQVYGLIDGTNNGKGLLGKYETEERAIEVLNEIQLKITKPIPFDSPVYEMPEK